MTTLTEIETAMQAVDGERAKAALRVAVGALVAASMLKAKVIVREDEEPRVQVFVSEVPSICIYAGEIWEAGFPAKCALDGVLRELKP